ncbi:hypothetical protein Tco_1010878 [Tanacetum coccineum]
MDNTRRYREYDLAHSKLVFEFYLYFREVGSIRRIQGIGYGVLSLFPSWSLESRKERLSLPTLEKPAPEKPAPVYYSRQRDPKAPPMTLLNQDLFYLKYGNSGPKKYTLSLHKYPIVPFPNDDIEEQTSRYFITEIVVRRANGNIDPVTESNYKHLNKNNIEDLYLLCVNGKVIDYKETGLLGSLSVFIRSTVICERVHDFQLGMESYQ